MNEFGALLREERDRLLAEMREGGFFYNGERRYDAMPWDVNNGYCDTFAQRVQGRVTDADAVWLDELLGEEAPEHCVVVRDGRYYDAECLDGVWEVRDLPIFRLAPRPTTTTR